MPDERLSSDQSTRKMKFFNFLFKEFHRTIELRQFVETTVHLSIYLERPEYHGMLTTGVEGETTASKGSAIIRSGSRRKIFK